MDIRRQSPRTFSLSSGQFLRDIFLSQFALRPGELRRLLVLHLHCAPSSKCYFRRPHCVCMFVNADNSIPAISTHVNNTYAKFHQTASTEYRDIVSLTRNRCQRTDGRTADQKTCCFGRRFFDCGGTNDLYFMTYA